MFEPISVAGDNDPEFHSRRSQNRYPKWNTAKTLVRTKPWIWRNRINGHTKPRRYRRRAGHNVYRTIEASENTKITYRDTKPPKGTLESEYSEPLRIIQDLRLQKEGQLLEGSPYLNPSNSNPFVTNCPHNFSPVLPLPFA